VAIAVDSVGGAVVVQSFQSEAILRGARMLRTALGPAIAGDYDPTGFQLVRFAVRKRLTS